MPLPDTAEEADQTSDLAKIERHRLILERRLNYIRTKLEEAGPERALGMHFDVAEVEALEWALKELPGG
jgi:hypothetical protein